MVAIGTAPLSLSVAEQDRYVEYLTLSTTFPVAEHGIIHPGISHDQDRLTEPYLLLQDVLSAMAKQLGDYWQQTVTQGSGRYVANDVEQKVYRYPGCLSVLPQREDTLDEVKWALTTITEMDFCARLVLPEGESVCGVVNFDKTDDLLK